MNLSENSADQDVTKLYRQHATMLRHTCRRILNDAQLAEDVTQESFMQYIAYAGKHVVQAPGPVLYRIATRLAVKKLRMRKADVQMQEHLIADTRPQLMDQRLAITKVLKVADEDEAHIAVMHFVEGLSHDEIAEVMAVSRRTVGNRIDRFCRRAAKLLALPDQQEVEMQEAYDLLATSVRRQA